MISQYLDSDLNDIGIGCIPKTVQMLHKEYLEGPYVVQILSCRDICKPNKIQSDLSFPNELDNDNNETSTNPQRQQLTTFPTTSSNNSNNNIYNSFGNRMLKFDCTDGKQKFICFEYRPLKTFPDDINPGAKLLISKVLVRRGVVMLIPECCKLLGGHIEELK